MADKKRDWGFWGFWVAVSGVLVAAGAGLYAAHQPVWGFRLIIIGLALVALCILAVIVSPLYAGLSKISRYALGAMRRIGRAIAGAYVATGAFFLRPLVERIARGGVVSDWTAGTHKLSNEYGCYDYKVLALQRHRVANAQFALFPDYSCKTWIAGLALASTPLNFDPSVRTGKVMCYLESQTSVGTKILCRRDKDAWGYNVQSGNYQRASFVLGLTTFPEQTPGRLAIRLTVDGSPAGQLDGPTEYARHLILFAWADGGDFRVDFTQIHVSWAPE